MLSVSLMICSCYASEYNFETLVVSGKIRVLCHFNHFAEKRAVNDFIFRGNAQQKVGGSHNVGQQENNHGNGKNVIFFSRICCEMDK